MITFRATDSKDMPLIMSLVRDAQAWFSDMGIDQWQDGYPNCEIFERDIAREESYVMLLDGIVVATACISFDGEPTYHNIYEGEWQTSLPYVVIHRLVVNSSLRGRALASEFFDFAISMARSRGVYSLRVDTHKDNIPMQRVLQKLGCRHSGRIVLQSGADREAYELSLI